MQGTARRQTPVVAAAVLAVLLLAIGGWAARRYWQQRQIPDNERTAVDVLKILEQLELQFRREDLDANGVQDYWTADVAGLFAPYGSATFSGGRLHRIEEVAHADPDRPDGVPYRGYWFVPLELDAGGASYRANGGSRHPSAFAFVAYPAKVGLTGRAVFIVNENKAVLKSQLDGPPPRAWPSDPELRRRWSRAD